MPSYSVVGSIYQGKQSVNVYREDVDTELCMTIRGGRIIASRSSPADLDEALAYHVACVEAIKLSMALWSVRINLSS